MIVCVQLNEAANSKNVHQLSMLTISNAVGGEEGKVLNYDHLKWLAKIADIFINASLE